MSVSGVNGTGVTGTGVNGAGTRPKSGNPQVKSGPVTAADRNERMKSALAEWADNPR